MTRHAGLWCRGGGAVLLLVLLTGCASSNLFVARHDFYAGRYDSADAALAKDTGPSTDRVLFFMERGMVRQARGDYAGSTADWLDAVRVERDLETHSVSKAAASMIVNDTTLAFRGWLYERALLRTCLGQNYMARALWDDAAVEGRNVIQILQNLNGYPDDAFSRYFAGFSLEMVDEDSSAALQYRVAGGLTPGLVIDENTGRLAFGTTNGEAQASGPAGGRPRKGQEPSELVCFVGIGRGPSDERPWSEHWAPAGAPYAEIHAGGRVLGRSYPLANVASLLDATEKRRAVIEAAKEGARVALKTAVSEAVGRNNRALGDLLFYVLFSLEKPDTRRWETLPMWLEVARVPCPADLRSYEVVFRYGDGSEFKRFAVAQPLVSKRNTFVSFCRDLPPAVPAAAAP